MHAHPSRLALGLVALTHALALGCTDRSTPADEQGDETMGDGDGDLGDGDGDPGDGDGEPGDGDGDGDPLPSGDCSVSVTELDACEDCPLHTDVVVSCDDTELGAPGLRVAPLADGGGVYLAFTSSNYGYFAALTSVGGTVEKLPEGFARTTLALAQDPDGIPHVAADTTQINGAGEYPGGPTVFSPTVPGAEPTQVYDIEKYAPVLDFEFDALGRAHLFILSDAPDQRTHAWLEPGGEWQLEPIAVPGTSGWQRFGINRADAPVAFDFVEQAGSWSLFADEGDGPFKVSSSFGSSYPGAYTVAVAPELPSSSDLGPRFLTFSQHGSVFKVSGPIADGTDYTETLIPSEPELSFSCLADYTGEPGGCPVSCEEVASGVEERGVGVARTSDGRVFVAWLVTHFDQTHVYQEGCAEEVGCWCNWAVERDDSWGELVLAELDLASDSVVEHLRMPMLDPELFGLFGDYRESPRFLDMRAFGTELAIGVRLRSPIHDVARPDIRVLGFDTTLLPALP